MVTIDIEKIEPANGVRSANDRWESRYSIKKIVPRPPLFELPFGANVVAGVAAGVFLKVILVVIFRAPEI